MCYTLYSRTNLKFRRIQRLPPSNYSHNSLLRSSSRHLLRYINSLITLRTFQQVVKLLSPWWRKWERTLCRGNKLRSLAMLMVISRLPEPTSRICKAGRFSSSNRSSSSFIRPISSSAFTMSKFINSFSSSRCSSNWRASNSLETLASSRRVSQLVHPSEHPTYLSWLQWGSSQVTVWCHRRHSWWIQLVVAITSNPCHLCRRYRRVWQDPALAMHNKLTHSQLLLEQAATVLMGQ